MSFLEHHRPELRELPVESLDWQPQIFFRLSPRAAETSAFDAWERTKHCPELVQAPGVSSVHYFETVSGLPAVYAAAETRMVFYTADSLEGLFAWMRSDELEAGLDDGAPWIAKLNELDGSVFTANVYEVSGVERAAETQALEAGPLLFASRYEVEPHDEQRFDTWAREEHLPALASHAGVTRARSFRAIRADVPIPLYRSTGSRMVEVSVAGATLTERSFLDIVLDSLRWDQSLPYVARGVYQPRFHFLSGGQRDSAD